ncbi:MAG: MEDS domain-containing protein [Pyrinomonadaceae bacterium]
MLGSNGGNQTTSVMVPTGSGELVSKRIAPTTDWTDMGSTEHFVQFYESDEFIVSSVAEYLIHGLKSGECCIIAATPEHIAEIENIISEYMSGLEIAKKDGRFIALNAHETLSEFMVDGMPDPELFSEVVGTIVRNAHKLGGGVRAYGEMVGVLCSEDNFEGAIKLEDLWNKLRDEVSFSLFCGYPMSSLSHPTASHHMVHICSEHSRVIPGESYTALPNADSRLRAIAALQQKTHQLKAELAEMERRMAEKERLAA